MDNNEAKIDSIQAKSERLEKIIKGYGKIAVAFSGGVDSTFLLKTVNDLSNVNTVAFTFVSAVFPKQEIDFTRTFCADEGIDHIIIEVPLLDNEDFIKNTETRCYTCKKLLFEHAVELAGELDITHICEGSNADDESDYRPGKKAIKEMGILSPLKEAGLTKDEIRFLSRKMNLPTWEKPAMACLATRIPYGKSITKTQLSMIEKAESYLADLGFSQVRVRIHDDVARLEIMPEDFEKMISPLIREQVYSELSDIGFSYVSLDLKGYRTGSMNESLK